MKDSSIYHHAIHKAAEIMEYPVEEIVTAGKLPLAALVTVILSQGRGFIGVQFFGRGA